VGAAEGGREGGGAGWVTGGTAAVSGAEAGYDEREMSVIIIMWLGCILIDK